MGCGSSKAANAATSPGAPNAVASTTVFDSDNLGKEASIEKEKKRIEEEQQQKQLEIQLEQKRLKLAEDERERLAQEQTQKEAAEKEKEKESVRKEEEEQNRLRKEEVERERLRKEEEERAHNAALDDLTKKSLLRVASVSRIIPAPAPAAAISLLAPATCTGYMAKQGQVFRTWKVRFFVLEKGLLSHYVGETSLGSGVGDQSMGTPLCLRGYAVEKLGRDGKRLLLSIPGSRMTIRETAIRAKTEGPEPVVNPEESLDSTTGVLLELYTPEDTVRWEAAFIEHIKYIGAVPELAIS